MTKNNQRPDRASNRKAGNTAPSPEHSRDDIARELKINKDTQAYYDELLANPRQKQVEAYKKTHSPASHNSAVVQASRLARSDKYAIYSERAVGKAKRRIVQLVDSRNESIAYKASADILDRTEGKAITKQEITQKTVSVKLDLQGLKIGAHYIRPELSEPI